MFSKKQLLIYAGELVVIIVGILIAFQVEEWREGLQQDRELQAALVRLREETAFNLDRCSRSIPSAIAKADDTLFVLNALQTGELRPEGTSRFESGLARMAGLRKPGFLSTVAEEMIATGLLKNLENSALRVQVAQLPELVSRIVSDYSDQRQALSITMNELAKRVEFRYRGSFDTQTARGDGSSWARGFESDITVEYDFEALAGDNYFINLMIEAADTHGDLYGSQRSLCDTAQDVIELLPD
jgi:hypothetical protein